MQKTKLINNIDAKLTGRKKYLDHPLLAITFEEIKEPAVFRMETGTEYRVGVKIGASEFISDELLSDSKAAAEIKEQSKRIIGRGIANYVYGDIRSKLVDLAIQLHHESRSDSKTHNMVNELLEMITYD
jgi:hypothetical protein